MKAVFTKSLGVALAIAGLAVALPAYANIITYNVGGWTKQFPAPTAPPANAPWGADGYPGDTVTLQTYTGTLDLTAGTYVQKINTLLWTINYTYGGTATDPDPWSDVFFSPSATRSLTFDGVGPQDLSQGGTLRCTWDNDFLGLSAGSTISFIVQGYQVDITPLALAEVGGSDFSGGNPWVQPSQDVMAQFVVTAVPEPTTMIAGALLLLPFGASTLRMLRKRQVA
jgi:hypothetical protein